MHISKLRNQAAFGVCLRCPPFQTPDRGLAVFSGYNFDNLENGLISEFSELAPFQAQDRHPGSGKGANSEKPESEEFFRVFGVAPLLGPRSGARTEANSEISGRNTFFVFF